MSVWVLYLEEHPFFSTSTFQMAEIHHIINGGWSYKRLYTK